MNIFENQVILTGIHNLSKTFRPNLATIRVFFFGMIFIPKSESLKWKNMFSNFESFRQRMNNKMFFFVENSPGTFIRDKTFRMKSSWSCMEEYNDVNKLCFNVSRQARRSIPTWNGNEKSTKYVQPKNSIDNFKTLQKHQCGH